MAPGRMADNFNQCLDVSRKRRFTAPCMMIHISPRMPVKHQRYHIGADSESPIRSL